METSSIERSGIATRTPTVVSFEPRYRAEFARLNYEWIEKYFSIEEPDRFILDRPEDAIIAQGGEIFFAVDDARVIGTVALKVHDATTFELTKMAVDESERGRGIGRLLLDAALAHAHARGAERVILSSHTSLVAAITMYRTLGFVERVDHESCYSRCNIYMEKRL